MDQAEKLRSVVKLKKQNYKPDARVITVTSGKGGVGKSNVAVNLAVQMQKMGKRVLVFDADFGLANVEVMFGAIPKYNLADVILVDTGAGIANHVLEFVLASPEVLVVTTPEPTSLTDSYSLLKSLYRNPKFDREYTKISVLSNRVISAAEGRGVYDKLNTVVGQFLEGEITYAGMIPQDSALEKAIRMQKPVSLQAPLSKSARAFEVVAAELLQGESSDAYRSFGLSRLFSGFWKQKNEGVE